MRRSAGNFRKQISVNKNGAKPSPAGRLVLLQFSGNGCLMGGSVRAGYPGRRTVARSKSLFNPGRGAAARARLVITRTSAPAPARSANDNVSAFASTYRRARTHQWIRTGAVSSGRHSSISFA